MIAIDQYGQVHKIRGEQPRKELLELFGKASAKKIYRDKKSGGSVHIGYVVGGLWLTLYSIFERPA